MDYNYVRMRNAAKAGDTALEMRYKKLLRENIKEKETSDPLNVVIAFMAAAAVALGAWIMHII